MLGRDFIASFFCKFACYCFSCCGRNIDDWNALNISDICFVLV